MLKTATSNLTNYFDKWGIKKVIGEILQLGW